MQLRPGQHARRRRAVLAGVEVAGDLDALDDGLEVGVVEHDHGRLAAQLEVHPLQRVGRGARDLLAGCDVSGQRDHRDVGMADEACPGRLPVPEDDVQHSLRKVLGRELGEARRGQGRLLGGLQHHRVPGGQRWPDLPDRHHQGVVPRRDLADDADRLAADHRRVAAHVLAGGEAVEGARHTGEEAQVVDQDRHLVGLHRLDRLADIQGLELRQLIAVLLERVGDSQQRQGALAGRSLGPLRECALGGLHRGVDVVLAGQRGGRDLLARGRVQDRLARPVRGRTALAVDEVLDLGGLCDGRHRSLLCSWSGVRQVRPLRRRSPRRPASAACQGSAQRRRGSPVRPRR